MVIGLVLLVALASVGSDAHEGESASIKPSLIPLRSSVKPGAPIRLMILLPEKSPQHSKWTLYFGDVRGEIESGEVGESCELRWIEVNAPDQGKVNAVLVIQDKQGTPTNLEQIQVTVEPSVWLVPASQAVMVFLAVGLGIGGFFVQTLVSEAREERVRRARLVGLLSKFAKELVEDAKAGRQPRNLPEWIEAEADKWADLLTKPPFDQWVTTIRRVRREQGAGLADANKVEAELAEVLKAYEEVNPTRLERWRN